MNTNCLEDKRCPECKQEEEILLFTPIWISLKDEGTDPFADSLKGLGDTEFDNSTTARCPSCGFEGTLLNFTRR